MHRLSCTLSSIACCCAAQTFSDVYYSVDMPPGQEENKGQRPEDAGRLSILNVRSMKPCLSLSSLGSQALWQSAQTASRFCAMSAHFHCLRLPPAMYLPDPETCAAFGTQDVSGAFRPNILTAFMGETGAGKVGLNPKPAPRIAVQPVRCCDACKTMLRPCGCCRHVDTSRPLSCLPADDAAGCAGRPQDRRQDRGRHPRQCVHPRLSRILLSCTSIKLGHLLYVDCQLSSGIYSRQMSSFQGIF